MNKPGGWVWAVLRFLRTAAAVGVVVVWIVSGALWVAGYWRHVNLAVTARGSLSLSGEQLGPRVEFDSGKVAFGLFPYLWSISRPSQSERFAVDLRATCVLSEVGDYLSTVTGGEGFSWPRLGIKWMRFTAPPQPGQDVPPRLHLLVPHWMVQAVLTLPALALLWWVMRARRRRAGQQSAPKCVETGGQRVRRGLATWLGCGCGVMCVVLLVAWLLGYAWPLTIEAGRRRQSGAFGDMWFRRVDGFERREYVPRAYRHELLNWFATVEGGTTTCLLGWERGRFGGSAWMGEEPRDPSEADYRWMLDEYSLSICVNDEHARGARAAGMLYGVRQAPKRWQQLTPMALYLPCWAIQIPLIVATGLLLRPWWRQRRAMRWLGEGKCAKCGYDLTGNVSGVCPECGTAVAAKPAV